MEIRRKGRGGGYKENRDSVKDVAKMLERGEESLTVVLVVRTRNTSSAILVVAGSGPTTSLEASPNLAHFLRAATDLGTLFLCILKTLVTLSHHRQTALESPAG